MAVPPELAPEQWLTYRQAGELLGVGPDAIRVRARREGWRTMMRNDGSRAVLVPPNVFAGKLGRLAPKIRAEHTPEFGPELKGEHGEQPEQCSPAPDLVAILRDQLAELRLTMERQERTAEARHAAEIDRLMGQVHAERTFWIERADAAEMRAEEATKRADARTAAAESLALDALAQATAACEQITAAMIQAADRPLWRRLFG